MSCYMTMKGKLKKDNEWVDLFSVTSSSSLYEELRHFDVAELESQVKKDEDKLRDYFELAKSNTDYYEDYASFKPYVEEEKEVLAQLKLIQIMMSDARDGFSGFTEFKFEIE